MIFFSNTIKTKGEVYASFLANLTKSFSVTNHFDIYNAKIRDPCTVVIDINSTLLVVLAPLPNPVFVSYVNYCFLGNI
jgi:hypothetical protein